MENTQHVSRWRFAVKSASLHLLVSLVLAGLAALLVFEVWYPFPYAELTGGLDLYKLVVSVDIVCGPLLTLILASPKKKMRERVVDFSLIGAIQLAALIYGLYSVSLARPVAAAFERDRINIVTAAEIDKADLAKAKDGFKTLPWFGIERVGIREAANVDEGNESLSLSLTGIEPSMRPNWWLPDGPAEREKIRRVMKPLSELAAARNMSEADIVKSAKVSASGKPLFLLPLTSGRTKDWVVIMDENADFVGYAPIDGFMTNKAAETKTKEQVI